MPIPITCPKCGHKRTPLDTAPDWQCPKCLVAYAKVGATPSDWRPPPPLPPPPSITVHDTAPALSDELSVRVVDIKMPFWSMVVFMVKWAAASIPALLILAAVGAMAMGFINGLTKTDRERAQQAQEDATTRRAEQAIKDKKIFIGMKAADVERSWGAPQEKNVTQFGGTRVETWRYRADANEYQFITITDGLVTSISGPQG